MNSLRYNTFFPAFQLQSIKNSIWDVDTVCVRVYYYLILNTPGDIDFGSGVGGLVATDHDWESGRVRVLFPTLLGLPLCATVPLT